jgi:hypothetical protein
VTAGKHAWRPRLDTTVVLVAAALPRIWAAWVDQGIFWPDEIYQTLEQAHRAAFGYGLVPWEFREGARSWLFPGLFAVLWKLAAAVGINTAPALVRLAKLTMAAVGLTGVVLSMRLARRLGGDRAAIFAGALCAAFPPALVFGSRCMPETASAPLLLGAVAQALLETETAAVSAGALAACATVLRYQNGIVGIALLALLLRARRWQRARNFIIAFGVVFAIGAGVLDWATWGAPFHSLRTYVKFNVLEKGASRFGIAPWWYYLRITWTAAGWPTLLILVGLIVAGARAAWLIMIVVCFLAAHSVLPHKEYRFLMPVVPLALTAAAVGWARLKTKAAWSWTSAFVVCCLFAAHAARISFADMGQYMTSDWGAMSPWHWDEPANRMLWRAGLQPDLCGIGLVLRGRTASGGYSYLHRNVPMFWSHEPRRANYVIAPISLRDRLGGAYQPVAQSGEIALFRREGECVPE